MPDRTAEAQNRCRRPGCVIPGLNVTQARLTGIFVLTPTNQGRFPCGNYSRFLSCCV